MIMTAYHIALTLERGFCSYSACFDQNCRGGGGGTTAYQASKACTLSLFGV